MDENDLPEIKTGYKMMNLDLAATTNDRMKKTVIELRNLGENIKVLNTNIVNSGKSSDKYSKRLLYLTWALVVFTIFLVIMTAVLIIDAKEQTSSQNNIALNTSFFSTSNTKIIDAIENNQPILTENKGQYNDAQLDNYLGEFDTIESSYEKGLLSEADLCDSFSFYIGITNKNSEIKNYIIAQQKTDPGFFIALSDLAKVTSQSKNVNCR